MQAVGRFAESVATNVFTSVERATGCAAMVKTGDGDCTISMPDNAVVADNIAKRGAHDDGFWHFDAITKTLVRTGLVRDNPVWVYTDGTLTVNSPAFGVLLHELAEILTVSNVTVYAPMQ